MSTSIPPTPWPNVSLTSPLEVEYHDRNDSWRGQTKDQSGNLDPRLSQEEQVHIDPAKVTITQTEFLSRLTMMITPSGSM